MDKPALQERDEDGGQVLYFTTHLYIIYIYIYMDVSKNRGIPRWMVYNGKPY